MERRRQLLRFFMKILSISSLFPTPDMKNHGVFVENRLLSMSQIEGNELSIINPIPSSPIHKLIPKYKAQQSSPLHEHSNFFFDIYRPRFFSIPGFFKDLEHLFLLDKVRAYVRDKKIDAIDVHWTYPDAVVAQQIAKELNVPYFVTLRGSEAFYEKDNDNRNKLIKSALEDSKGIISLSEKLEKKAFNLMDDKFYSKKSAVIRNGVDINKFPYVSKNIARSLLSLGDDDVILLGVGSLIERKGFHHVISSLKSLAKMIPEKNIKYYILGESGLEGDYSSKLKDNIALLNSSNERIEVVLFGSVSNNSLYRWYNAADIFCLSSFDEGSPNVLSEALSCGCPAVCNDVGSVVEIMNSEEDLGTVISTPLSSRMDELSGGAWASNIHEQLRKNKTHNREKQYKAMSKYTWDWCANKALNFIENAVNEK